MMPKVRPIIDRIEENTFYSPDGCWYWTGKLNGYRYGKMQVGKKLVLVHRLMYSLYVADPGKLYVCHKCDNHLCINPNHLFAGDQFANMRDMVNKGRRKTTKGDDNPKSKLTELDVLKIRGYSNSPHADLAAAFGVSRSTISSILTRRTWSHI